MTEGQERRRKPEDAAWHTITPIRSRQSWRQMSFGALAVRQWYALEVRAGTEPTVEALLERRGFVAVVPMRSDWRAINRYVKRRHRVEYPIAPRYVFVGFGGRAEWERVFDISMVYGVVGFDGMAQRLSGIEVALFLQRNMDLRAPDAWQWMRKGREFDVGDEVDVVAGDFAGRRVRVRSIEGDAARVIVPFFGKRVIPLVNLERAD